MYYKKQLYKYNWNYINKERKKKFFIKLKL